MRGNKNRGVRQPLPAAPTIEQVASAAEYAAMLAAQRFDPYGVKSDDWLYVAYILYDAHLWAKTPVLARLAQPRTTSTSKPVKAAKAVSGECLVAGCLYGALHAVSRYEPDKPTLSTWCVTAARLFDRMSWTRPPVLTPYPAISAAAPPPFDQLRASTDDYPAPTLPPGTLPPADMTSFGMVVSASNYIALVCQDRMQPGEVTTGDFINAARLVYLNFGWIKPTVLE